MTNETERIELLKAVADCAPEWMEAYLVETTETEPEVFFMALQLHKEHLDHLKLGVTLSLHNDIDDSPGIIAMLDAMEKAGGQTQVGSPNEVWDEYHCWVSIDQWDGMNYFGATRAEAVSRAFVAVFGGKK